MEMIRRRRKALTAVAVALCALALLSGAQLLRIHAWNALLSSPAVLSAPAGAPAAVQLARAHALAQHGDFWAALTLYQQVASASPGQRAAALFNQGNLLLRRAVAMHVAGDDVRAQPLFGLAKASYRQLLREHPADWDARYNLELALRWAPELDDERQPDAPARINVRRSAIIRRAMPQGLP